MEAVSEAGLTVGTAVACAAVGVARATFYRWRNPKDASKDTDRQERPAPPRTLSTAEREAVLNELHSDRFVDKSVPEVFATLLDEGRYYCAPRTMYRILAQNQGVRERRDQLKHPEYKKPELLATAPNRVWSWDITKLLGPQTWTYFYLYVVIDIFSRYVVGWMVATRECASLATQLIEETSRKQGIDKNQLTIHSDRGSPMKSLLLSQLLAKLGVTRSFSRPHVSNDNPFSESQFKTMKYQPDFPDRFGSLEDARGFCVPYFDWYNNKHHHSGIAMLTPSDLHLGRAPQILEARRKVLEVAYQLHPERFVKGVPIVPAAPAAVWINPPIPQSTGGSTTLNADTEMSQTY